MQFQLQPRTVQATDFVNHQRLLLIAFLFVVALGTRLYHIGEPPLDFHATRQYRSLLIARGFYYDHLPSIPDWKVEVARINRERQGVLEPPVMEFLASVGYRLVGGELFWIPRSLAALFWLAGGVFLYLIAEKLTDANSALFSTIFYLFTPFAVSASRSFQPDPLMIMLLLGSIYGMLRYDEQRTPLRLSLVILISAITIFIKPVSLFVIYSSMLVIQLIRQDVRKSKAGLHLLLFSFITLLPALLFYIDGIYFTGFLERQARSSFLPQLLLDPFFWRGWLNNLRLVVGFTAFVSGLLGVLMIRQSRPRYILIGLWIGYIIFCFVFNYHIATHDYYHLQLIPIIAISLGPLVSFVTNRLLEINQEWYWRTALGLVALFALILLIVQGWPHPLDQSLETKVKQAEEIGVQVNHSIDTVYLASDYGLSLEYHGELSGLPWPLKSDLEWERLAGVATLPADDRFRSWFAQSSPSYFIVVDLHEYEQQPDLKNFLSGNYPIFAQDEAYLIYDLKRKR